MNREAIRRAVRERLPRLLADSPKPMVGFRNIAVHDDQSLQLPIVVAILHRHQADFPRYNQSLQLRDSQSS